MDPYAITFLLKLGVFDSPEEIFDFLKKRKLIYIKRLPANPMNMVAGTILPGMRVTKPIGKWLLKKYLSLPQFKNLPQTKEILSTLSLIEHIGKRTKKLKLPAIITYHMPKKLEKLPPVDKLMLFHELSHAGRFLRHPVLHKPLFARFAYASTLYRLIDEYLSHKEALKWLKKPLPKKYPLVLRSPLAQALAHLKSVQLLSWLLRKR